MSLAGISLANQTVSVVDRAAWQGDFRSSGIIGLAYPALTAGFPGNDPTQDRYCSPGLPRGSSQCNQIEYSSLTDNMFFQQKLTKPVFALALSRDESGQGSGGYLTIGGIPNLSQVGVKKNEFASTQIKILPGDDRLRYYLMSVESVVVLPAGSAIPDGTSTSSSSSTTTTTTTRTSVRATTTTGRGGRPWRGGNGGGRGSNGQNGGGWNGGWNGGGRGGNKRDVAAPPPLPSGNAANNARDYILDSGTTLSFLPDADAKRFNNAFNPPAQLSRVSRYYMVNCTAQVPPLGLKIGGTTFWHNPKDLVKRVDFAGTMCISGIQSSVMMGGRINILGDVFMNSVLAVFDLGQGVIKFAARREYPS